MLKIKLWAISVTATNLLPNLKIRPNFALHTISRLLTNSIWVALSDLIWRFASVVLFTLVAHTLGDLSAGRYTVTLTVTMLAFSLSVWGLDQLLIRDIAQRPEEAKPYFSQFLLLRVLFSLLAMLILWVITYLWLPYPIVTKNLIFILTWSLLSDGISDLCQALFMGLERMYILPLTSGATGLLRIGVAGGVIFVSGSLLGAIWALLLVSVLRALLSLTIAWRLLGGLTRHVNKQFLATSLSTSLPFFFINACLTAEGLVGILILSGMAGEAVAGHYGAANSLLTGFALLPAAYRAAVFPLMSRSFKENPTYFRFLYHRSYLYLVAVVVPIVASVIFLAAPLMTLIGGATFSAQWPILATLILVLPLNFLTVPNSRYMIITHRQRILALVLGGALGLNVLVNLLLVPLAGAVGTASARVISLGFFFAVVFYYLDRREMKINLWEIFIRPLIAGIAMTFILWSSQGIIALLLGWIVYVTLWLLLGGMPAEDRNVLVRRFIKSSKSFIC